MNVLQLIQAGCYEANITSVPSTLLSLTSANDLQLLNLFYSLCRELRGKRYWPQLKKKWVFQAVNNVQSYQMPVDYLCGLPRTWWDTSNRWELIGPLTDAEWNYRTYGYIVTDNRIAFRVFGPNNNSADGYSGQFQINPTPGITTSGRYLSFEYITKTFLQPPRWTPNTAVLLNAYVNVSGNIYQCTNAGTTSAIRPPNMVSGVGLDGSVRWAYVPTTAWAGTTLYDYGQYVSTGGRYYQCTGAGQSASVAPTHTSGTATDGTVTWTFIPTTAWAGETTYASGSYVTSGSYLYLATTLSNYQQSTNISQTSGKIAPSWNGSTITDGTVTWTWIASPYEQIQSDSDECLFDDDIMIKGLRWKFLQARGFEYQDLKEEWTADVDATFSRFNPGRRLSLSEGDITMAGLHPRIPEGNMGS